jgi:ABC-type multidrug transport system fused ATPase/permease subunit
MIHGLIRSPSKFFDTTPSGRIISKFSNDLGVLDDTLPYILLEVLEGLCIFFVMLAQIFSINYFFIIAGAINLIFFVICFLFCKKTIL